MYKLEEFLIPVNDPIDRSNPQDIPAFTPERRKELDECLARNEEMYFPAPSTNPEIVARQLLGRTVLKYGRG